MKAIAFISMILFGWCGYAQQDSVVYLDEVEILGAPVDEFLAGTVIRNIKSGNAGALDELATNSSIYFKQYGNSQLSTITLRGTSSSHTNVIWNGLPVNSPTLGQTDFSVWPMFLVNNIALQKGSGSSTFGSGAVGGSIVMDNSLINPDSLITIYSGIGSFGQFDMGLSLQMSISDLKSETRIFNGRITNNFPYQLRGEEVRQEHAGVKRLGFSQRFNYRTGKHFLFAEAAYAQNDRQIQPTITSTSRDVLLSENLRMIVSDEIFSGDLSHFVSLGYTWDQTTFNTSSTTGSHQLIGNYAVDVRLSELIRTRLGMTAITAWADSDNYDGIQQQKQLHLFSSWTINASKRWLFSLNLREAIHDNSAVFVPSFGTEWRPFDLEVDIKMRGQVSRGYRVPTFNDLFWSPGGNPDLQPELSLNYEAGFDLALNALSVGITGFISNVDQWIQWLPTDGIWGPENIREVQAKGLEASVNSSFNVGKVQLLLEGNYEFTRSRDLSEDEGTQLPYVPIHSAFGRVTAEFDAFRIGGRWNYTGERFSTLSNSLQGKISDYNLLDLIVGQSIRVGQIASEIQISANNLLDVSYENVLNTAMPGRNYLLELTIKY